ncbi:hypothetical protein MBLNU457_7496t1 [Dothideomycetes sp. NU457]
MFRSSTSLSTRRSAEKSTKSGRSQDGEWEDLDAQSEVKSRTSSHGTKKKHTKGRSRSRSRDRATRSERDERREARRRERQGGSVASEPVQSRSQREQIKGFDNLSEVAGYSTNDRSTYPRDQIGQPGTSRQPLSSYVQDQFPGQYPSDYTHNPYNATNSMRSQNIPGSLSDNYSQRAGISNNMNGPIEDQHSGNTDRMLRISRPAPSSKPSDNYSPATNQTWNSPSTQPGVSGRGEAASYYDTNVSMNPSIAHAASQPSLYHSVSSPAVPTTSYYAPPPSSSKPSDQSQPAISAYAASAGVAGLAAGAYAMYEHNQDHSEHYAASVHVNHPDDAQSAPQGPSLSGAYGQSPPLLAQAHRQRRRGPVDRLLDILQNKDDIRKMEEYTEYIGVCRYCFDPASSATEAPRQHHFHGRRSAESLRRRSSESLRRAHRRGSKNAGVDKDSRYYSSDSSHRSRKKSSWIGAGLAGYGLAKVGAALWNGRDQREEVASVKSRRSDEQPLYHSGSRDSRTTERGVVHDYGDHAYEFVRHKDGSVTRVVRPQHAEIRLLSHEGGHAGASSTGAFVRRRQSDQSSSSGHDSPGLGEILEFTRRRKSHRRRRASPNGSFAESARSKASGNGMFGGLFSAESGAQRRGKKSTGDFFNFANDSSSSAASDLAFGSSTGRQSSYKRPNKKKSKDDLNATLLKIGATAAALTAAQASHKKRRPEVVAVRERKTKQTNRDRRSSKRNTTIVEDEWESASEDESISAASDLAFGEFHDSDQNNRRRASTESITSQSSGLSKWGWRWGGKGVKRSDENGRPSLSTRLSDTLASSTWSPTPQELEGAPGSSTTRRPMQILSPEPVPEFEYSVPGAYISDHPSSSARPTLAPLQHPQPTTPVRPEIYPARTHADSTYSAPTRASTFPNVSQDATGRRRRNSSPSSRNLVRDAAVVGAAAAATAGIASALRSNKEGSPTGVRFDLTDRQAQKVEQTERARAESAQREANQQAETDREERNERDQVRHQKDLKSTSPPLGERSGPTARALELEAQIQQKKTELEERARLAETRAPFQSSKDSGFTPDIEHDSQARHQSRSVGEELQYEVEPMSPKDAYSEESIVDDEIFNLDFFKRPRTKSEIDRYADIARKVTARIVSENESKYTDPQPTQAQFFYPDILSKNDQTKKVMRDIEPDNDYQINYVDVEHNALVVPLDIAHSKKPWSIPSLKVIAPTPPISVAGSIKGQKSPDASPMVEQGEDEKPSPPSAQRSPNSRVSWGQDDTRIYNVDSPEVSPALPSKEFDSRDEIVVDVEAPGHEHTERYVVDDPPRHPATDSQVADEYVEEVVREASEAAGRGFYRSPFFETVSDLGIAMDLPDDSVPAADHGFVIGEIEGPTPTEEKLSHMPGSFDFDDDEVPSTVAPEQTTPEEVIQNPDNAEDKPSTPREAATSTRSSAESDGRLDRSLTEQEGRTRSQSNAEDETTPDDSQVKTVEDPGPVQPLADNARETPLSKRESKKRDKAALSSSKEDYFGEREAQVASPDESQRFETPLEQPREPPLSKKERKRREKAALRSYSEDGPDTPVETPMFTPSESRQIETPYEDSPEVSLSRKEQKKRDKAARLAEAAAEPSPSIAADNDDWDMPLSSKERKKRAKQAKKGGFSDAVVAVMAGGAAAATAALTGSSKSPIEEESDRADHDPEQTVEVPVDAYDDLLDDSLPARGNGLTRIAEDEEEDTKEISPERVRSSESPTETTRSVSNDNEYGEPRRRKKKHRSSGDLDDDASVASRHTSRSSRGGDDQSKKGNKKGGIFGLFRRKSSDKDSRGSGDSDSKSVASSTRRSTRDEPGEGSSQRRRRHQDEEEDEALSSPSTPSQHRDKSRSRDDNVDEQEDQSFLGKRVEVEEPSALPADSTTAPTPAPESTTENDDLLSSLPPLPESRPSSPLGVGEEAVLSQLQPLASTESSPEPASEMPSSLSMAARDLYEATASHSLAPRAEDGSLSPHEPRHENDLSPASTPADRRPPLVDGPALSGNTATVETKTTSEPASVPSPDSRPTSPIEILSSTTEVQETEETRPSQSSPVFASPSAHPFHTPRRPMLPIRPSSSTTVPLRFRRPPGSPSLTASPNTPRERAASLSSPVPPSPTSPVSLPASRLGHRRGRSNEMRHFTEFQPLYLVEHNRKPQESAMEEEPLPSLPSSKPTSRASSVQDNEEHDSTSKELPVIDRPVLPPLRTDDFHENHRLDDVLGSGHSTPRASQFSSRGQEHVTRAQPEFYSWEDMLREEDMRNTAGAAVQAKDEAESAVVDLSNPEEHEAMTGDVVETTSWPESRPDPLRRSSEADADSGGGQVATFSTVFEDDRSPFSDAADIKGPKSDSPADQAYQSSSQVNTQPVSEPDPGRPLLERRLSKEAKKGKRGEAKLGRATVTSDQPEVVDAEEAARRQQQDTADALGSWVQRPTSSETPSSENGKDTSEDVYEPEAEPAGLYAETDVVTQIVDPAEDIIRPEDRKTLKPESVASLPTATITAQDTESHGEPPVDNDLVSVGKPVSAEPESGTGGMPTNSEPASEPFATTTSEAAENAFQGDNDAQSVTSPQAAVPASVAFRDSRDEPAATPKKSKGKKGKQKAFIFWDEPQGELTSAGPKDLTQKSSHEIQGTQTARDVNIDEEADNSVSAAPGLQGPTSIAQLPKPYQPEADVDRLDLAILEPEATDDSKVGREHGSSDGVIYFDDVNSPHSTIHSQIDTERNETVEHNEEEASLALTENATTDDVIEPSPSRPGLELEQPTPVQEKMSHMPGAFDYDDQPPRSSEADHQGAADQQDSNTKDVAEPANHQVEDRSDHELGETEVESPNMDTNQETSDDLNDLSTRNDKDVESHEVSEQLQLDPEDAVDGPKDTTQRLSAEKGPLSDDPKTSNDTLTIGQTSAIPDSNQDAAADLDVEQEAPAADDEPFAFTVKQSKKDKRKAKKAKQKEQSAGAEVEDTEPLTHEPATSGQARLDEEQAIPEPVVEQQDAPYQPSDTRDETQELQPEQGTDPTKKTRVSEDISPGSAAVTVDSLATKPRLSKKDKRKAKKNQAWSDDVEPASPPVADDHQGIQKRFTTPAIADTDVQEPKEASDPTNLAPSTKKGKRKSKKSQPWSDDWIEAFPEQEPDSELQGQHNARSVEEPDAEEVHPKAEKKPLESLEPATPNAAERADQDQLGRRETSESAWVELPKKLSKKEKRTAQKAARFESGDDNPGVTKATSSPGRNGPEEIDLDHVPMPGSFDPPAINNDDNEVPAQESKDSQSPLIEPPRSSESGIQDPSSMPEFEESGAFKKTQPDQEEEVSNDTLVANATRPPNNELPHLDEETEQESRPLNGLPSDQAESRQRSLSPTASREDHDAEQMEERQQPSLKHEINAATISDLPGVPSDKREAAHEQPIVEHSPDANDSHTVSTESAAPRAHEKAQHAPGDHEEGEAALEHTTSYPSEEHLGNVQADFTAMPDRHTVHHHLHRSGSRNLGLLPGDLPSSRHSSRAASPAPSQASSGGTLRHHLKRSGSRNLGLLPGDLTSSRHSSRAASPVPSGQTPHDVDFAATLAAGLGETGFDPNIVVNDPSFHRRASPPGMADLNSEDELVPCNKDGKERTVREEDDIEVVPNVAGQGASDQADMEPIDDSPAPRAIELSNQDQNITEDSKDDGFDAALAASLGVAGFSAADMLGRSAAVPDEPDEFSFAPKNKKKRKGRGNRTSDVEELVGESGPADTAGAKPNESLAPTKALQSAEESGGMQPAKAAKDDEWATTKKGKKAKGRKSSSQATREPSPIRASEEVKDPSVEQVSPLMTLKKPKKNKKGKIFDWTAGNDEAEQARPAQEAAADKNPQLNAANPVDISQTTPSHESQVADAKSVQPAVTNSQEEPAWSFDNISDGGPQVKETPHHLSAEASRDSIRDSGYDTVRNSQGITIQDEAEPQNREVGANEASDNWNLPVQKSRFKGKQLMRKVKDHDDRQDNVEPEQAAPKSPEPTTKERASYLFNTPSTAEKAYPRSTVTSDNKMQGDYFGGRAPESSPTPRPEEFQSLQEFRSPHVPLSSPTTKTEAENDIDPSARDIESARRFATPIQSFRGRMNAGDGSSSPAADFSGHTHGSTSPTSSIRHLRLATTPIDENRELSSIDDRLHGSDHGKRFASDMQSPSAQSYASSGNGRSLRSPDQLRSMSAASNRSLKRTDRSMSGDLRAAARRGEPPIPAPSQASISTSNINTRPPFVNTNIQPLAFQAPLTPPLNEADAAAARMANVHEGWGNGERTSVSPTRPPSGRKRQSMHLMDMEAKINQLTEENRRLQQAHEDARQSAGNEEYNQEYFRLAEALKNAGIELQEKDVQITQIRALLDPLQAEVSRLTEINENLGEANRNLIADTNDRYATLQSEHAHAHDQWQQSSRELEALRERHAELSSGIEDIVHEHIDQALADKNAEIRKLRDELEITTSQIRALQSQIQQSPSFPDYLPTKSEDYFDSACQKLCQAIQQWILRFSKSSDNRACRLSDELDNDKLEARLDNVMLDGSDVDKLLVDRVRRRDVFMSLTMAMVWEYIFTRYLFGMDREQRQKLKALEKTLHDVGPPRAVAHWRATTLTLLSRRPQFASQRALDTEAVTHEIFSTLAALLPPPAALETQLLASLKKVLRLAVDLAIDFRLQRPEYLMLPPPCPEYDTAGDLVRKTRFEAGTMNERSGEWSDNEELVRQGAVVKMVLFPLVMKKGDDEGEGGEETVICPAQVLVAGERAGKRVRLDLDVSSLGTGVGGRSKLSVGSMGTF